MCFNQSVKNSNGSKQGGKKVKEDPYLSKASIKLNFSLHSDVDKTF